MHIRELYQYVRIPPNLERHMFEVASVGDAIAGSWTGPSLNNSLLRQALLVHDLGNLVKFRRPFLGELEQNAPYWEEVQESLIEIYGSDAHEATLGLLTAYSVRQDIYDFIEHFTSRQLTLSPFDQTPWEILIAELADLSVSPEGIVGMQERLNDIRHRYAVTFHDGLIEYVQQLQGKIQQFTARDLQHIQDEQIFIPEQAYWQEIVR